MKGMKYVLKKELARVFFDKKLVFSVFILPALVMFLVYALMGQAMKGMINDIEKHKSSVCLINAPEDFVSVINSKELGFEADYTYEEMDGGDEALLDNYKSKIMEGELDLIICFPGDFAEKIMNYSEESGTEEIPEVKTYYNPSEDYSSEARTRLGAALESYRQQLLALRVGDLDKLVIFSVDLDAESSIIEKEGASSAKMLSMLLPYLIVILLFSGPMSLGIDSITGEKERGTMASMLVTPVRRSDIVTGKVLAVSIMSLISSLIYAGSMIIAIPMMQSAEMEELTNISVRFNIVQVIQIILIMLVLVYLYVNLVSLIAVFARNAKEAQTLIMPIYILVMVAGVLTIFGGNTEPDFMMYGIPVYGSAIGIQQIIAGNLEWSGFLLNVGITLVVSAVLSLVVTKEFNNEKVMFNA